MKQILRIVGAVTVLITGYAGAAVTKNVDKKINFDRGVLSTQADIPAFFMVSKDLTQTGVDKTYALTRAEWDDTATPASVKFTPMVPAEVLLNGATTAIANPLAAKSLDYVMLYKGIYPLVTDVEDNNISIVTDPVKATTLINNPTAILDATLPTPAALGSLEEVAADDAGEYVFAAVGATTKTWGDLTDDSRRGIAVLKPMTSGLTQLDPANMLNAATPVAVPKAAFVDLKPAAGYVGFTGTAIDKVAATFITRAEVDNGVIMHFNPYLGCLYVGLTNAKRDYPGREGGVMGLFRAKVGVDATDGLTKLTLSSFINTMSRELFYSADLTTNPPASKIGNDNSAIVGFYYDGKTPADGVKYLNNGGSPAAVSITKMASMHTSTGRDYLIVQSAIGVFPNIVQGIYALPLLGKTNASGVAFTGTETGSLSAVSATDGTATFDGQPTNFDQMPWAHWPAFKVNEASKDLTDMFVVGDTVFVCKNSATSSAGMGIWATSAIFNEAGAILGWSAPYRVTGTIERAFGGGLDPKYNSFYTLTARSNDPTSTDINIIDAVKITDWGKSDAIVAANNLSTLLATIFPATSGGVVSFTVFDEQTPGFSTGNTVIGVALGLTKVALIQLGTRLPSQFVATKAFIADSANPNQNVFVFDSATDTELAKIAPFTCAEVSRMTANDSGWLFIGGYNGVAVLSNDTIATADKNADSTTSPIGRGWASNRGLLRLEKGEVNKYPYGNLAATTGASSNWSFKKLPPTFFNVRKMLASNRYLNVLMVDKIQWFEMAAPKFIKDPTVWTATSVETVTGFPTGTLFSDFVPLTPFTAGNDIALVATSNGLYASNLESLLDGQAVKSASTSNLILALQLVGNNRPQPSSLADVHALGVDFANNNDMMYYLKVKSDATLANVASSIIVPNATSIVSQFGSSRQGFMTYGTHSYSYMPKQYDNSANVWAQTIGDGVLDLTSWTSVGSDPFAYPYGVVKNAADGTSVVICDKGVDVNQ